MQHKSRAFGPLIFFAIAFVLGAYFTFAAVQGSYGIFRSVQIQAEISELETERDALRAEVKQMANLTHRLSDRYLDLDLLDQQARDILGLVRADEVVIR
ncbi:septum formation initiator precursor [Thioclava sp. SK-1]|uniref:FtsB family cell division protein n=1 Tax=Thioclava sp. SK-1 TaxID=1889770 RepID=UPI00082618C4|nr:septum formation initiator family protein [Thioclava sp. SK-1]OCX67032.1 septum formation initiator precursor [Thioclava sp. SK-1]